MESEAAVVDALCGELVGGAAAGEHEHAQVVLVAGPGVECVNAGAALPAERRECSASASSWSSARSFSRLPTKPVGIATAGHGRFCRGQPSPRGVHGSSSVAVLPRAHCSGTLITARAVLVV